MTTTNPSSSATVDVPHPIAADRPAHGIGRPDWTARILLAADGALFGLFPVLRPWPDETHATPALARAMASDRWMVAHLCAVAALITWPFALAALRRVLGASRAIAWAVTAAGLGTGLALPYFGAEIFAIHELAGQAVVSWDPAFLDTITDIRFQPVVVTMFATGLLLVGASGILLAVAWWRSEVRAPRWAAIPLGAAIALFAPQFFAGEPVRVTHGVLLGLSAWLLAALVPTLTPPGTPAGRGA
jgi:hypothetical protein